MITSGTGWFHSSHWSRRRVAASRSSVMWIAVTLSEITPANGHALIMAVNGVQPEDHDRDDDQDHPGTLGKLRGRDDYRDQAGGDRPDPVDDDAALPARLPTLAPARPHARLRAGEGDEHPCRI